jgi:predicted phosphodiesterase
LPDVPEAARNACTLARKRPSGAATEAARAVKLNILSDLHLSFAAMAPPRNGADVVVLAGDIARPAQAAAWALGIGKPVVFVLGNHEFYGGSLAATVAEMKRHCAGSNVHVLDDEALVLGGVRFLGSTLWTDFSLLGEGDARIRAMAEAQRCLRDFTRIRSDEASATAFTPQDSAALFATHARWLAGELARPHAGPTVVVTHHAPSPRSIHPRFAGSLLNAAFVSHAAHLAGGARCALWIHGHTHDSFDYDLAGTRVVCNPRGYARGAVNENPCFDADLTIEVGPPPHHENIGGIAP